MKNKFSKVIVLAVLILIITGVSYSIPTPTSAICDPTNDGPSSPPTITSFTIGTVSNGMLPTSGAYSRGGHCLTNPSVVDYEGSPSITIVNTSIVADETALNPTCSGRPCSFSYNMDVSSLSGGNYTALLQVENDGGTVSKSVGFTVTAPSYTLTVNKAGTGSGTVGGAGSYTSGTVVTATGSPDTNSTGPVWSGDCNSNGQVTMNASKTCTATFTLTPLTPINGSCAPAHFDCASPESSTNRVTGSTSYTWTCPGSNGGTSNTSCKENIQSYIVTANNTAGPGNTGSISPNQQSVAPGSTAAITLTNGIYAFFNSATGCGGAVSSNSGGSYTYTTGQVTSDCSVAVKFMFGSLDYGDPHCTIPPGQGSCNIPMLWTVYNPITVGGSKITTPTNITVASGDSGNQNFSVPYTAPGNFKGFFLYNNGSLLAQDWLSASCADGTTWNGSTCGNTVNPSGPYTVTPSAGTGGTMSPNTPQTVVSGGAASFVMSPNSGFSPDQTVGGTCPSGAWSGNTYTTGPIFSDCTMSVTFTTGPTGTLTGTDCTIPINASTCTTTLNLNITNPVSGAQTNITKPVPAPNTVVVSGIVPPYPQNKTGITVNYPSTIFYLNHNGSTLNPNGTTVRASCDTSTSTWDGTKCASGGGGSGPDLTAGNVTVTPFPIYVNTTTANFSSIITNQGNASTGASFSNFFQVVNGSNGLGTILTDLSPTTMSTLASGTSSTAQKSYVFTSTGAYSVRACADKTNRNSTQGAVPQNGAVIDEGSNEGNNCSPSWTNLTVTNFSPPNQNVPVVTITASPTFGPLGTVAAIFWSATNNPTSCTADTTPASDWSGAKAVTGAVGVGPFFAERTYTYNMTCSNSSGKSALVGASVTVSGTGNAYAASIYAKPNPIFQGISTTLIWNSSGATSCSVKNSATNAVVGNGLNGSASVSPKSTTTYNVSCAPAGSASVTVIVKSTPTIKEN
jgi:hypothetical protein